MLRDLFPEISLSLFYGFHFGPLPEIGLGLEGFHHCLEVKWDFGLGEGFELKLESCPPPNFPDGFAESINSLI